MPVTYTAPVPANPSAQLQAVFKILESGAAFDTKGVASVVTEDFTHVYLPENAGLPKFTKAEFVGRIDSMTSLFTTFNFDVKEIIEAPGAVVIHMAMRATTKGGASNDEIEVMNVLYVAEQADGTHKVTKSKEYVDTVKWTKFAEAVQKELSA
ncbi:hypothetical protein BXZ70DRAFT_1074830 [Cristinia sonorae]|uniref:SnoaL-like domain-containing protein n=1 Tax=Cristinia sonorae TaxID=1940300 RepID=A0A8K0V0P3_9AGAR|nr:hypothetical protein BXZ70DRAFT_1074830 [Cristinia sonorae]